MSDFSSQADHPTYCTQWFSPHKGVTDLTDGLLIRMMSAEEAKVWPFYLNMAFVESRLQISE